MTTRDHDKAKRYIDQLDLARCNDNWQEVPELIRKVNKHAPERTCLITTARIECEIAATSSTRPTTSSGSHKAPSTEHIPKLLSVIETETKHPADRLQAQTCLAWIHWMLAEPALAATRLPKDYSAELQELGKSTLTGWTEVCVVKGACLKGTAQNQAAMPGDAITTFRSILSLVPPSNNRTNISKELLHWSDQFLAQLALVASKDEDIIPSQEELALRSFRLWASQCQKHPEPSPSRGTGFVFLARPQIWKAYYVFLSRLIQEGYEYPDDGDLAPRLQQYTEFKRVESMHENNLLKTIRFPKAHSSSLEIETWVEQVIQTWKVFCGPTWRDKDFGQVGKGAVSRSVLDILYRAATKTFHSTIVLRRLFQVHLSLAEFDEAYKALDTYIEIIKREKAKAAKAGEMASEIDDENTILRTLTEGIEGLCCFGSAKEAHKAKEYAELVDNWISSDHVQSNGYHTTETHEEPLSQVRHASHEMIALSHRAIGVASAQWARFTPFTETRSTLQKEAIRHLKISIALNDEKHPQLETSYALGLALAETRDLAGAVQTVKTALTSTDLATATAETSGYIQQRKMIPLWHLLALIMSGRHEFATADRACEGAFETFPSPDILFGNANNVHLNGNASLQNEKVFDGHSAVPKGLVDDMERLELERIIEIRMTRIALIEVVEGPEVALNGTNELLRLFVRLFGRLGIDLEEKPVTHGLVPPKSSAGTVKSFRGSIFGRKKAVRSSVRQSTLPDRTGTITEKELERVSSGGTTAPTIQVTDEDKSAVAPPQRDSVRRSRSNNKLHRHEGTINRAIRRRSEERASRAVSSHLSHRSHDPESEEASRNTSISEAKAQVNTRAAPLEQMGQTDGKSASDVLPPAVSPVSGVTQTASAKQDLPSVVHNYKNPDDIPPPPGHKDQPPQQDIRLPTVHANTSSTQPLPRFPHVQAQKHALGILVKIWLLIAGLYRRASMSEDSREACEEAQKHASRIEALVSSQESSARAFADPGWGGGKSSNELLADICAERGILALTRSAPHDAIDHLEQALSYVPRHGKATVALSNILLDIYTQKIPAERPQPGIEGGLPLKHLAYRDSSLKIDGINVNMTNSAVNHTNTSTLKDTEGVTPASSSLEEDLRKTPANLNRLAARDRAYGLLTAYTKLGSGWDDSEAWFALARAHEESGQADKAQEVLWWCVELEDTRPIRGWRNLGSGGYVLR